MSPRQPLELAVRALVDRLRPGARILRLENFAPDAAPDPAVRTRKAIGYGDPIHITIEDERGVEELVLHRAKADQFGHDRRADRVAELVLAFDTFGQIPAHVRAVDVGLIDREGVLRPLGDGEPYLLSSYARGKVYAEHLRRVAQTGALDEQDRRAARTLALYLAALHHRVEAPGLYRRAIRDLLGGGEGIFGLVDAYPEGTPGAPADRLFAIEEACLRWRWRLRDRDHRLCRIHGDFHPFNIVLGSDGEPRLLDAARGCRGDAADDLAALAINFPFFAMSATPPGRQALATLFDVFFSTYLDRTGDRELLEVIAPFFAWRALVVVNPAFYPGTEPRDRERMLDFASSVLAAERFEPGMFTPLFT